VGPRRRGPGDGRREHGGGIVDVAEDTGVVNITFDAWGSSWTIQHDTFVAYLQSKGIHYDRDRSTDDYENRVADKVDVPDDQDKSIPPAREALKLALLGSHQVLGREPWFSNPKTFKLAR
jgi:hypothetical protein